jgi:hypothetical protein
MAYTASFLVKNQAMGDKFCHHIRVTADAASGSIETAPLQSPAQQMVMSIILLSSGTRGLSWPDMV